MPKMVSTQQKQAKRRAALAARKMQALRAKYDASCMSDAKKAERLELLKKRFPDRFAAVATLDAALALLETEVAAQVAATRR